MIAQELQFSYTKKNLGKIQVGSLITFISSHGDMIDYAYITRMGCVQSHATNLNFGK